MNEKKLKNLFLFSILIIFFRFFNLSIQLKKIFTNIPIYTDYIFLGISSLILISLLLIPNRNWRIGVVFILISNLIQHFSIIKQNFFLEAFFLTLMSMLFLVPALFYFYKLRKD